ncbi:hypothetical protein BC936DRAFT_144408 [Jimgerdemannia flammicorona]|uniref:FAD binding domain-containing protein n=1 Tax=Jimgerdemannia flammicorona TaxID=994334 RepID=A0A433DCI1_9FUNG|nr:hypothetical protein BC936DRAFT_144408 [Jimgerdemannia flammicorona]
MSQPSSSTPIIDVLVVGAGPVGLFFANEMQAYGCTFRIIDRNSTPSIHSKAIAIMSRTLEALDNRNLIEPFFAQGRISNYMDLRTRGKPLALIPTVGTESPFPYPILLSQVHTEGFLEDALRKSSGNDTIVERDVNLVSYQEDDGEDVVVATLARVDDPDRTEVVKARYIVGCDGVHSAVRKGGRDWTFEGHSYKSPWALADLIVESDHIKNDRITMMLHPEGPVTLFPFEEGLDRRFRIVTPLGDFGYDESGEVTHGTFTCFTLFLRRFLSCVKWTLRGCILNLGWNLIRKFNRLSNTNMTHRSPKLICKIICSIIPHHYSSPLPIPGIQDARHQHNATQPKEMTLEELRELIDRRVAPEKLVLSNPKWISSFRINERLANGYRRGRAFVVGDAAHCHSPMGGQGMNMGLQDAHNLGWKIALAVQGKVKDADLLLESYSIERVPIARKVLSFTTSFTKRISKQGFFAYLVPRYIIPLVVSRSRFQSEIRSNMLGFKIAYPSSPLNHPTPSILRQVRQRKSWLGFLFRSPKHLIEPGEHMPDGILKLPRIQPGRDTLMLYDVVRGTTTHTLLLFASGHGITRDKNPLVGKVLGIAGRYKSTITAVVIGFKNVIEYQDFNDAQGSVEKTFAEQVPALHACFGVPKNSQAVVVVRPDLYVAFSATEEEVESGELEKFLAGYLVEESSH